MKYATTVVFATTAYVLSIKSAAAFDIGFLRVPDWMDQYLFWLLVLQLPFWLGLLLTKPGHIPFNQMYKSRMGIVPTFFLLIVQVLFFSTMALFFVGMALVRTPEWQSLLN